MKKSTQSTSIRKNEKFVCIFDSSHSVESEEKLIKHMAKCKVPEKQSFELCKYNGLHWVKYDLINEHESSNSNSNIDCPSRKKEQQTKNDFIQLLPQQISSINLTRPFEIDVSMIQSSSMVTKNSQDVAFIKSQGLKGEPSSTINKKYEKQPIFLKKKTQLWKQPDFLEFLKKKRYKSNNQDFIDKRAEDNLLFDSFLF